jgi:hypothetical protein
VLQITTALLPVLDEEQLKFVIPLSVQTMDGFVNPPLQVTILQFIQK